MLPGMVRKYIEIGIPSQLALQRDKLLLISFQNFVFNPNVLVVSLPNLVVIVDSD